jgi:hypothetical protein
MPQAALQLARQTLSVPLASVTWEVKVAMDFRAVLASAGIPFEQLSAEAQAKAGEQGYAAGDTILVMLSGKLAKDPAFDIVAKGQVPGLAWVARTTPPKSLLSRARTRGLRDALDDPSLSEGAKAWAKAEMDVQGEPELAWVLAADVPHVRESEYGKVIAVTKSWAGGRQSEPHDLAEATAGPEAATLLHNALRDGESAEVVRHDQRNITFFSFRLEPAGGTARIEDFFVQMHELWPTPAEIEAAERAAKEAAAAAPPETCWFCKSGVPDKYASVKVEMYAPETVERSSQQVGIQVQKTVRYTQTTVRVPRCRSCWSAHDRITNGALAGGGIGLAAGLALGLLIYFMMGRWELSGMLRTVAWIGIVLAPVVGLIAGGVRGTAMGQARVPAGIALPEDAKKSYPPVMELLEEGYKLGAPRAT